MNHLSFATAIEKLDGLIFKLRIDGVPIADATGCAYSNLPYWLIQGDLAATDESPSRAAVCDRIVAVCDCGEFCCGGAQARVTKNRDTVTFSDFKTDGKDNKTGTAVVFSRTNYEDVMDKMTKIAAVYKHDIHR